MKKFFKIIILILFFSILVGCHENVKKQYCNDCCIIPICKIESGGRYFSGIKNYHCSRWYRRHYNHSYYRMERIYFILKVKKKNKDCCE